MPVIATWISRCVSGERLPGRLTISKADRSARRLHVPVAGSRQGHFEGPASGIVTAGPDVVNSLMSPMGCQGTGSDMPPGNQTGSSDTQSAKHNCVRQVHWVSSFSMSRLRLKMSRWLRSGRHSAPIDAAISIAGAYPKSGLCLLASS